jgi:DNA-binding transcriptional LysR family regulator
LQNRFVDLVHEAYDVAIRIGNLADSRLIARRLCTNRRVVVASPDYIERKGTPQHPRDLVNHDCTMFTGFSRPREWKLFGPDGPTSINVSGRVASNNIEVLLEAARRGLGFTLGPTLAIVSELVDGKLVRVLPEWVFEPTAVFVVYPSALQQSSKVRAAVDFLAQRLKDPTDWDAALVDRVPGFEGWLDASR